jgi:hypothetical protein
VNEKGAPAQFEAMGKWGAPQKSFDYLKAIKQPTLVVDGGKDVIIYTVNSFILQQNLRHITTLTAMLKIQLPHLKTLGCARLILAKAANSKSMSPFLGGLASARPTYCRRSGRK